MAFSYTWNESSPDGSTDPVSGLDTQIQNLKKAIRERVATLGATGSITPEGEWLNGIVHYNTTTNEINYSITNGTAWQRVGVNFSTSCAWLFYTGISPLGWVFSASNNNSICMAVVTQTDAGGGTVGTDGVTGTVNINSSGTHTHTSNAGTAHTHTITDNGTSGWATGAITAGAVGYAQHTHTHSDTASSESAHTHTVSSSGEHTHSTSALNLTRIMLGMYSKKAVNS